MKLTPSKKQNQPELHLLLRVENPPSARKGSVPSVWPGRANVMMNFPSLYETWFLLICLPPGARLRWASICA